MENWTVDPTDVEGPYAPGCSSRAAEGFYSGALLGAVWGVIGRASSTAVLPTSRPALGPLDRVSTLPQPPPPLDGTTRERLAKWQVRAFGRGAMGYAMSAVSTAGVFGVFVGIMNAGTCACERLRGEKDWKNNMCGGGAGGLSMALLSRHTRSPRMVAAHVVGGAALTSFVALASRSP